MSGILGVNNLGETPNVTAAADPSGSTVQVFFEIAIGLSGEVEVLSSARPTLYQIVKCEQSGIRVNSLYKGDVSGILEFWEASGAAGEDARENIKGAISSTSRNADASFNTLEDFSGALYTDLDNIFCKSNNSANLNATAAAPFNADAYKNPVSQEYVAAYSKFSSLGELMLAWAAHYAFGHVAATAAIENDLDIIQHFNVNLDVPRRFMNAIASMDSERATRIVRSAVAQDPERALNRDNNGADPHRHMALKFRVGDLIYLRINVEQWTVVDKQIGGQNYAAPTNLPTTYTGANMAHADELTLLQERLPAYVGGANTDQAEAARGTYFHFEIPVIAAA